MSDLRAQRRRLIGSSLRLAYDEPLTIVRGEGAYLFDATGRRYLDAVNNVCHIGHSHPDVVQAAADQMARLNTNTRYLHPHLVGYAQRLLDTLPEPLRTCYFVSSGSEANELALRLARAYTGRNGAVVVRGAYHGNTNALIELSPYKYDGPGGAGRPPHVQEAPTPDVYRGPHRDPDTAGAAYASAVGDAARRGEAAGHPAGAFFCEPLMGCAGQIEPPGGYLAAAFTAVRDAGGVCVADEVQVGFGRVGSHFWGFETQGVVPDIVTMGKPMGNGHPIGAVVTTPEIAAAFDNGMEYFNSFGGNPVSCAVGLAVLDVIEREGLQQHALDIGEHLTTGLRRLSAEHPPIGDVRGRGLFVGVELVRDPESREPDGPLAKRIVEAMKEQGVLLSRDGPDQNVLKIKPPLVFSRDNADELVDKLEVVLSRLNRTSV